MASVSTVGELIARLQRRKDWPPERLKAIRQEADLSLRAIAKALGTSAQTIGIIETSSHMSRSRYYDPYIELAEKIEQVLLETPSPSDNPG
jgi:DNA-binding XRE family transcriptional regulator